jgi:hypothetical protein
MYADYAAVKDTSAQYSVERYVIGRYLRISQDDRREGESNSIASQRDLIENYILSLDEFSGAKVVDYVEACDIIEPKPENPYTARDSAVLVQNLY